MKITIDTAQDSKEQIREAIKMLTSLVGQSSPTDTGLIGNTNPEMFSLFNDSKPEQPKERSETLRIIEY